MAYAVTAFIFLFVCMIVGIGMFVDKVRKLSSNRHYVRRAWITEHLQEIKDALLTKDIQLRTHDFHGNRTEIYSAISRFSFVNETTGKQTRVISAEEFYDLIKKVEGSKDVEKLIFGKYLYRQFRVK